MTIPYGELDAVLLDLGNTLVGMSPEVIVAACDAEGIPCSPDAFLRAEAAARPHLSRWMMGRSSEAQRTFQIWIEHMLEALGQGDGDRPRIAARLLARVRRTASTLELWSRVLPGVPEALVRLRDAGLTLVVVSNSDGTAEQSMVLRSLRSLVHGVVDSAVVEVEKPDPRIFEHALAITRSRPERTLHVGDLYAVDVVGARGAGLNAVLLDPFGDWHDVDCEVATDLAQVAARVLGARR